MGLRNYLHLSTVVLMVSASSFACWRPFGGLFTGIFRGGSCNTTYYSGYSGCYSPCPSYSGCLPACPPAGSTQPCVPPHCQPGAPNEIVPPKTATPVVAPPPAADLAFIVVEAIPTGATLTVDGV